ncbi:MAG: sel1 repeat family protein, partial [Spirochaetaceae bacterium]|nr:sel1 repeat family protein [Spirochaetaceae bacterium]
MTTGKYDIYSKDFDLEDCMAQAQQGNPDAQVSIAFCYIRGKHGLKKDKAKGFEYLQKGFEHLRQGAESGDGRSMAHLGECYEEGLGVEKDEKQA